MSVNFSGKKSRANARGSALYIAIGLCCAAVLLVGISTFINNRTDAGSDIGEYLAPVQDEWLGEEDTDGAISVDGDISEPEIAPVEPLDASPEDTALQAAEGVLPEDAEGDTEAAVIGDDPAVEVSAAVSEPDGGDAVETVKTGYQRPLPGDLMGGFSGDELVYCSTMCDWRVHSGADIAGDRGSSVYAARDGIVYDVVEDALFGNTVIVQHGDQSMLYYCGLSSNAMVSKGMEIKAGDVIGQLDIVPCEAGDPSHLHLAMMKDGKFVDPIAALGL